jgi:hypothetical protein
MLGLLTAARGPLVVDDLAALTGARRWEVRQVLDEGRVGRILRQAGPAGTPRYAFAHEALLARCQQEGVAGPGDERRIREWAAQWRQRGWPTAREGEPGTPLYLLDEYPQTLSGDPAKLTALAGDAGWVTAAIQSLGVDKTLTVLRTVSTAAPGEPRLTAIHSAGRHQAHPLRGPETTVDPAWVPRQLCLQAAQLGETQLASDFKARQLACVDPGLVLQWTTKRTSPALVLELTHDSSHAGAINAGTIAVLPDGRVATGGGLFLGQALIWNPADPSARPVELGRARDWVDAVAALPDGRVITARFRRMRVWNPARPDVAPFDLGDLECEVKAMAVLPDGRVIIGGIVRDAGPDAGRVLLWDPASPTDAPVELGRHKSSIRAVAVLPDGRVVTGGRRERRADTGVGSGQPGRCPGRTRPPRGLGKCGRGAAGRPSGHQCSQLRLSRDRPGRRLQGGATALGSGQSD